MKEALYLVNEYGEFLELLRTAKHLRKTIKLEGTFVFGRDDYGRLQQHGLMAREAGFRTLSTDGAGIDERIWRERDAIRTDFGYRPASVTGRRTGVLPGRLAVIFLLAFATLAVAVLFLPMLVIAVIAAALLVLRYVLKALNRTQRFVDFFSGRISYQLARLPVPFARVRRWTRHAKRTLKTLNPDIVLMGQDYPGSYNSLMLKQADRVGVPSAIVPFAMYTSKEVAESFVDVPDYILDGRFQRLIFKLFFPSWVMPYRGRQLVRLPISEILALELTGNSTRHPWSPQYSRAHLLCQSPNDLDYYTSVGREKSTMTLTGTLWNDDLEEAQRQRASDSASIAGIIAKRERIMRIRKLVSSEGFAAPDVNLDAMWDLTPDEANGFLDSALNRHEHLLSKLRDTLDAPGGSILPAMLNRRLKLDILDEDEVRALGERPVVVFAWPANQYPRRTVPPFDTYLEFSEWLAQHMAELARSHNVDVWISLHPTLYGVVDIDELEAMGLSVIRWPLISFIHCADVFVATVSTTLLWAVQCAIPSVNFDCYDYGYREFAEMGCETCVSTTAFRQALARVLSDPDQMRAEVLANRDGWTMRDGQSGERIAAAIERQMDASERPK